MRKFGAWLGSLLCCALAFAWASAALAAEPDQELIDADRTASEVPRPDARAVPLPRMLPYREHGSWVRITPREVPDHPRLVVDTMVSEQVTLVLPDGRRQVRAKTSPDADADASPVALVFVLPDGLQPGTPLLLHFEHQHRAFLKVHLLAQAAWAERERASVLLTTVVYTALTAFAVVTFCFFLMVRERIYLLYSLFLMGWWFYMAATSGPLYWLPGWRWFGATGMHGQWAMLAVVTALGQAFARDILELRRTSPRLARWFDAVVWGLVLAALGIALSPGPVAWFGMTLAAVVFGLFFSTVLFGAIVAWRTRDRFAYYFVAGWTPMMIGGLLRVLQAAGVVETGDAIAYWYALGVLVQSLVLMVGLADRMLFVRRERDIARFSAQRANEASEAKSTFLANMSHELRTPLNAVLGFARLMRRSPGLSAGDRDNLGIIQKSGEHLLELINQVLSISKIEAGSMALSVRPFDPREVLGTLERMFHARCEEAGLEFRVEVDPALPAAVLGDAAKLRQVLINLLGNGVKFTREGHVSLRVRWDERRAWFEVSDTGHGIGEDELPTLFQPFVQTEAGRGAKEGTGLGLAISQRIVALMGGTISVESTVGRGTTFRFDVALEPCAPVAEQQGPAAVLTLAPGQRAPRIAVVDDAPVNRALLERLLGAVGIPVRTAEDGLQALALWREWKPELVFMDLRMPVMDGREATQSLRAEEQARGLKRTPVVALTASVFESEGDALLAEGFEQVIHKPYREEQIFAALEQWLGLRFVREAEATAHPAGPAGQADSPPAAQPARRRILVVDDDAINRTVVRELLKGTYEPVEASDGYEALRLLSDDPTIALVLLDIEMPGIGGIETVRRIRADARLAALPVIAMTAHADPDDIARLAAAGMDAHLAKPVDPEALRRITSSRLARASTRSTAQA